MSSVGDIRDGPADEYWERLRHLMGPEALITYWYLGRGFNQEVDPDTMSLRSDMRNSDGGLMAAPLAIAAPETQLLSARRSGSDDVFVVERSTTRSTRFCSVVCGLVRPLRRLLSC